MFWCLSVDTFPLRASRSLLCSGEVGGHLWRRYISPDVSLMNKDLLHLTFETLIQFGINSPFKINILCIVSASSFLMFLPHASVTSCIFFTSCEAFYQILKCATGIKLYCFYFKVNAHYSSWLGTRLSDFVLTWETRVLTLDCESLSWCKSACFFFFFNGAMWSPSAGRHASIDVRHML